MTARAIVIVGAGPAGMSAAVTLAEAGLRATVIDDNPRAGGQIYRQPAWKVEERSSVGGASAPNATPADRGALLRERFERAAGKLEILSAASAWGLFPPRTLAVSHGEGWQLIEAGQLVLACGAYEFVSPFPGWTLPGVLGGGGGGGGVKSQRVRPGKRVFLAGTGPFLLVVAHTLLAAGVEVVGVPETARRRDVARQLPGLLAMPRLLAQGSRYLRGLRRAGVPVHWGHVVTAADGKEAVEEVTFAPCDSAGRPDQRRQRSVAVDTLCVGYGFVPRIELHRLAGCEVVYDELQGGWRPALEDSMETSVEGVWTAGDCGGVAGAVAAELSGELVGLGVARRLGAIDETLFRQRMAALQPQLARVRRFAQALNRAYLPPRRITDIAQSETVVCRCEEITRGEIEAAVEHGGNSGRTIKVMTRLGMGPCQGRMCWPAASRMIAEMTGQGAGEIEPLSVRPPTTPVCLGDLMRPAQESRLTESPSPFPCCSN